MATQCICISSVVSEWLDRGLHRPTVLGYFDQVINVQVWAATGHEVVTLCSPRIGRGPLNIVVSPWTHGSDLNALSPVVLDPGGMRMGGQYIDFTAAPRWNPHPDWKALASRLDAGAVDHLLACAAASSAQSSLLRLVCSPCASAAMDDFLPALTLLDAWLRDRDEASLSAAVVALAGLGAGLTPAGDDFMCGLMLGLWATNPAPQRTCEIISTLAGPMTTTLSAAFLRRAACGQVTDLWMKLLDSIGRSDSGDSTDCALRAVTRWGHSSGADTLAGFLWLCRSTLRQRCSSRQSA